MRTLIRVIILALAAVGAKTLYDRLAPHSDSLKDTGGRFVDRVGSAASDLTGTISGAKDNVMGSAKQAATDVASAARDTATKVADAADQAKIDATRELEETPITNRSDAQPSV